MEALIAKTTPSAERTPIAEPIHGFSPGFYLSLFVPLQTCVLVLLSSYQVSVSRAASEAPGGADPVRITAKVLSIHLRSEGEKASRE